MKLSEYAKKIGVTYKTAWNHYQAGLIPNARKLPSGIIVIFEDEQDLMQDFVSLVSSSTARLYGRRRSKRHTELLISKLKEDDSKSL